MSSRRAWVVARVVGMGVLVLAAAGCAGQKAGGDVDKIQITHSQFDVSVKNTSGGALNGVKVTIVPVGRATAYTSQVARIENNEERSLGFTVFSDKDGITFSPRTSKPSAIEVVAKDIDGKDLHAEVPWKK
jgi:hypothetical protein